MKAILSGQKQFLLFFRGNDYSERKFLSKCSWNVGLRLCSWSQRASDHTCVFSRWAEKMHQVFVTSCDEDGRLLGIHCILFPCWKNKAVENRHLFKGSPSLSTKVLNEVPFIQTAWQRPFGPKERSGARSWNQYSTEGSDSSKLRTYLKNNRLLLILVRCYLPSNASRGLTNRPHND